MSELTADPRTDLDIIDVPQDYMKYFPELKGAVIHWMGPLLKYDKRWSAQTRIGILSDQCVYISRPDGGIVRCLNIRFVQELIITEQMAIGFKVGAPERDLLIVPLKSEDRDMIITIVGKVFYNLVGHKLKTKTLSGDTNSEDSLQGNINLKKPDKWTLRIEPIRSVKSLTKMMVEKQRKEDEERRAVEMQFHKIEEGLRVELQQYRAEEHNRLVQQLSDYAKQLEEKEKQIQTIKDTSISREDKEMWRHCPNCIELRRVLETNQNEEKQKILRLEKQIQSQAHIVQHLQVAIQFRTAAAKEAAELGGTDEARKAHGALKNEIQGAQRKNRELQQLILESPYLTPDVKARAVRLGGEDSGNGMLGGRGGGGDLTGAGGALQVGGGVAQNTDLQDMISEKEREIRYLKQVLMDATQKQVAEMSNVKRLLQKYDAQVVLYLERVFREQAQMTGLDARKLAESAAVTAMKQAQEMTGRIADARQIHMENQAALLPRGFKAQNSGNNGDDNDDSNNGENHTPYSRGSGGGMTPNARSPFQNNNNFASTNSLSQQGTPAVNPLMMGSPGNNVRSSQTPMNNGGGLTPRSTGLMMRNNVTKSPMQFTLGR